MRLKILSEGVWKVVAPIDSRGVCQVITDLEALAANPAASSTVTGLYALFRMIRAEGPRALPKPLYHRIDEKNGIYEFVKGNYRVPCFTAGDSIVVCTSLFRKKTQKCPPSEVANAIAVKNEYLRAQRMGLLRIEAE